MDTENIKSYAAITTSGQESQVEKRVMARLDQQSIALASALSAQVTYLTKRQNRIVAMQWTIVVIQFITASIVVVNHLH